MTHGVTLILLDFKRNKKRSGNSDTCRYRHGNKHQPPNLVNIVLKLHQRTREDKKKKDCGWKEKRVFLDVVLL